MKRNKKLLISYLITFILLTVGSIEVFGAKAPIPNNQTWDNFSLNSTYIKPKTINTTEQKTLEIKPDSQPVIEQTPILIQEKMPVIMQQSTITELQDKTPVSKEEKTTVMTQDKADAIEDLRNQAKLLYNANKAEEALKIFQQIPDSEKISDDWLYLANIAQDNEKDMDAIFYLKKAIQVDNNNYKAHYNLGNLYLSDKKTNMAIDEYNKAIKAKKDFSYAYYNKGCAYLKKNSYFNAKYEFGLAIKYNPDEPAFYYNLAYTYKMMNREKKANDALQVYEKLMQK